ncbi:hypothetical protein GRI72_03530 [Altererythrobacter marinus]|uniref:Uncharacterized protein n=1 Tax=Pelagerythrobacter marinus TaxID=538382 RepID=A0ABW9UVS4_9SPHN|nr:hypothetical protein [Pelagerythrobacter marinus]MXO67905.1 hypothetical protein [Pelagerythrobacter marinus]
MAESGYALSMLPAFQKIVSTREKSNIDIMRKMVGEIEPIVADIARHCIFEGSASEIVRESGETDKTKIEKHEGSVEIRIAPIDEFSYQDVLEKLWEMAQQLAQSTAKQIIDAISEGADKSGNVISGEGKPLSEELLLEALSTMSHSFDADGKWQAPSILLTPQQIERMAERHRNQSAHEKAEYKRRLSMIVCEKKAEYDREQARRILAG